MSEKPAIADLRREYTLGGLSRADLDKDPVAQFTKWLEQAIAAKLPEPNAMTLATADEYGRPSARIVLLKSADERGFTFYTNYESRKGRELEENPVAALLFFWPELERQVRISGSVSKLSSEESMKYFATRPKGSRLAAWVSAQSAPIANRAILERKLEDFAQKHPGDHVPLPPNWGGYCLAPDRLEFWQGRADRLHDRFEYLKQHDDRWLIERLSP